MPCMCYYNAPDEDVKYIKERCIEIITKIHELRKEGDPLWGSLKDVHELLDHLYDPKSCKEKNANPKLP